MRYWLPLSLLGLTISLASLGLTVRLHAQTQARPPAGYYRAQVYAQAPGQQPVEQTWWVRRDTCRKQITGWRPEGYGRVSVGRCAGL
jgi:hypothetical protein